MWPRLRIALTRLALLLAVAFVGDRLLAWGIGAVLSKSGARFATLYGTTAPADLVVLGNSRGVNGFFAPAIERRLGQRAMNLSFNGQSTLLSEALLRDWIDRHGVPKVVVLEVHGVGAAHDTIDALAPFWSRSERLDAIALAERPENRIAAKVAHLFAFDNEQTLRALYYLRRPDQDWINRYTISPALVEETRAMPPAPITWRDDNLAALGRIAALAREQGFRLRLVVSPFLPEYVARLSNYPEFLAKVREAAGGAYVWDEALGDRVTAHFADRLHANDVGAIAWFETLVPRGFFDAAVDDPAALSEGR